MGKPSAIEYRRMTSTDLVQMAALHAEVFPDYFLTRFGPRVVSLYYSQYLEHPHAYGFVAVDGVRVVGFIVGGRDITQLERRMFRRHLHRIAPIVLARFLQDREVRAGVLSRAYLVRRALGAFMGPQRAPKTRAQGSGDQHADPTGPLVSVLSTAVTGTHRGRGVGGGLQRLFLETAHRDGAVVARSNVYRTNPQHVERKLKAGWRVLRSDENKVTFEYRMDDPAGSDAPEESEPAESG